MIEGGANTLLMVSASDLREFALALMEEARSQAEEAKEAETYLTEKEACELLSVGHTTLWRWDRKGYLRAQKVGRRKLYRRGDIEKLIAREGK